MKKDTFSREIFFLFVELSEKKKKNTFTRKKNLTRILMKKVSCFKKAKKPKTQYNSGSSQKFSVSL